MSGWKRLGSVLLYGLCFMLLSIVFFSAFYLVWVGRPVDAGVMAGLFVVLLIAHNFSGIESFKAFSIEVKRIQATIQEAQATLEQLRQLALTSANSQFYQLSISGRWSAGKIAPKERIARELNVYLDSIEVPLKERELARLPYIQMIRTDLFNIMRNLVAVVYVELTNPISAKINALRQHVVNGVDVNDEERRPLAERVAAIGSAQAYLGKGEPTEDHFYDVMQAEIFRQQFGEAHSTLLWNVGSHLVRLYEDAKKQGSLTDEGLVFIQNYLETDSDGTRQDVRQSRYASRA